ncbi:MAG: glycosyltransferase [Myxococcales bacterium]
MKIALVVCGSRGDVQPMVALALGLVRAGHEVMLHGPPESEPLAQAHGCPFAPLGAGTRGNQALAAGGMKAFSAFIRQELATQIDALPSRLSGTDLVLGSGLVFGAPTAAERVKARYRYVALSPATILGTDRDAWFMRAVGWLMGRLANSAYLAAVNDKRKPLGLPAVANVLPHWMGARPIAATDAALTALPEGVTLHAEQTGYLTMPASGALDPALDRFLQAGPAPIYVGFGSMPLRDPARTLAALRSVARNLKRRLLVCSGWGGLRDAEGGDDVLVVEEAPHALVFPKVAAVVHHGGAGTVAAAGRAGVPQVVLPKMADQFEWQKQVVKLGLGPKAPRFDALSAGNLKRALETCLADARYANRAREIAARLAGTDGVALTVRAVEQC